MFQAKTEQSAIMPAWTTAATTTGFTAAPAKYQVPKLPGGTVLDTPATTRAPGQDTEYQHSPGSGTAPSQAEISVKSGQQDVEWGSFTNPSPTLSRGE